MKNIFNQYISLQMRQIILLLISIVAITSCAEDYDLKLKTAQRRLVVDGEITDSAASYVKLKYTTDYYDTLISAVTDAEVTITDGDSVYVFLQSDKLPGLYCAPVDFCGKIGHTYKLTINNIDADSDGIPEVYEAQSTMTAIGEVDSMRIDYKVKLGYGFWRFWIAAYDPVGVADFYCARLYRNGHIVSDRISDWALVNDEYLVEGEEVTTDFFWLTDDEEYESDLPQLGDVYEMELMDIPEDYFNYLSDVQEESSGSDPIFSGPSSNVRTNISGDAVGYFVAYSCRRVNCCVTQDILDLQEK